MEKKLFAIAGLMILSLAAGCGSGAMEYMNQGLSAYQSRDYDQAYDCFGKSIAADPQIPEAHYHLGNLYRDWKGEKEFEGKSGHQLAVESYDSAIRLKADYLLAYSNRAHMYRLQKKFDAAIEDYRKVLAMNPNNARAYDSLSQIYLEYHKETGNAGFLTRSRENLDKAIENDPENMDFYRRRAAMLYDQKLYAKSIDDYTRVVDRSNKEGRPDFAALMGRAKSYYALEDYPKAVSDINVCDKEGFRNEELSQLHKEAMRMIRTTNRPRAEGGRSGSPARAEEKATKEKE